jgi:plastocyanin
MSRRIVALAACSTLLPAAGCGSSKPGSSSAAAPAATTTSSTAGTTSPTTPTATSSIKASTRPKYGTPPSTAPVRRGTVQIAYRNVAINPDTLRVKVGTTLRWTNYDPVEHNVTSDGGPQSFKSKNFGEGAGFSLKVTRPGVIHYLCTIHPASMNGTIQVVG